MYCLRARNHRRQRLTAGALLALSFCSAAQLPGIGYAQSDQSNEIYSKYLLIRTHLANCFDQTQAPVKRIDSCTLVLDQGKLEKSAVAKVYVGRGIALNAAGRRDDAIADFGSALAADPKNMNAYSDRASLWLSANQLDQALSDLTVVIRADPANSMAFYHRGTAFERSGKIEEALEDYREAMRLQPSFAPAVAAVGRLLKGKDPTSALADLNEAVRLDPHSPALRSRATLYLSLGRFEEAVRDFDQVLSYNPADDIAYLDRGVAKEKLGHLESAIEDYGRSIELAPTAAAYIDRGNAFAQSRQPGKAAADFNAALERDPQSLPALMGKANASYALQKRVDSLDDYTRVIEADPGNAIAYFRRGNLHLDLKEFAAALRDYSAALKLDPDQPVALFNRSLAAARLGHREDAADDRRRALSLDPALGTDEDPTRAK